MTSRVIILGLLLSITGAQGLSHASESKVSNSSQLSLETVRQKLQLVKMLLEKSPSLARAASSDDVAAKQQAEKVHALYAGANDALGAGNEKAADELLDEALQLIENAKHRTPDQLQTENDRQKRYAEQLESARNLLATYHDLYLRQSPKSVPAQPEQENIHSMVSQAQAFAQDRHYLDAMDLLKNAHDAIITAINKLMRSDTLMYDLKFKSPSEEFDYEMSRYLSYEELIPIAYTELKPDENSIKLSERFVQESREMKDRARLQAAGGNFEQATGTLLEAVKHVQAALRIVGLVLPE